MGKILGPNVGYIDILDFATEDKILVDAARKYNPLRPSSGGECTKALGYKLMEFLGKEDYKCEPISAQTKRIFDLGHSIEYHIIRNFSQVVEFQMTNKQQSVLVTQLKDKNWIKGSMDWTFWSPENKCVADAKSKKDKFDKAFKTQWDAHNNMFMNDMNTIEKVYEDTDRVFWIEDIRAFFDELMRKDPDQAPSLISNFKQLNLYACTDYLVKQGVDHGCIIQYNKNDCRLREIRFKPCMELFEETTDKFHLVHDTITETGTPDDLPRDFTLGSIKCAFCDYNKFCRAKDNALKQYFNTFPYREWPVRVQEDLIDGKGKAKKNAKLASLLTSQYDRYKIACENVQQVAHAADHIVKLMEGEGIKKIKFPDGAIYELKFLKSPRPHTELRRSK